MPACIPNLMVQLPVLAKLNGVVSSVAYITTIVWTSLIQTSFIFADPSEDMCQEKKALYKLISGLHSSISVHIAYDYLLDESANLVSIYYSTLSLVLIRRFLYLI